MICLKAAQQPLWCKGVLLIPVSAWSCRMTITTSFGFLTVRFLALLFIHVSDPPISFVCRYRLYKIKNIMFLWVFLMLRRIFKNAIKFEKYIWYHCLPYWIKTMGKVQKINLIFLNISSSGVYILRSCCCDCACTLSVYEKISIKQMKAKNYLVRIYVDHCLVLERYTV